MPLSRLAAALLIFSLSSPALAAPLQKEDVPSPLASWISWALRGHEQELCPFYHGQPGRRACAWGGPLKLELGETSGRFEQTWTLQAPGWVFLPGSQERWPQSVRVDGAPAPVVLRGAVPALYLKAGARAISGSFAWDRLPQELEIPADTGLLSLSVRGKLVPIPSRDENGRLWLQAAPQPAVKREQAHLEVTVHRKLVDDAPLELTTRVQLKVSGGDREVRLGPVLPEGFAPMSLTSPLPARLDPDGRLRVQTRAGVWDVLVVARKERRGDEVSAPRVDGPWAESEAWVFVARPDLRLADATGAPSLDPAQTELPSDWRVFPAYLLKPGGALKLVQRQRGDDPPAPDRLALERELWLDFDGKGFSARDSIRGTLGRSWRLEAAPETQLGRVAIGGVDQFLTTLAPGGPAGIEVRSRDVALVADSRVDGGSLTAAGWRQDFESVSARLHLPPGWRLLHASGVDQASPTWAARWTLLDFFLVLIAAAAFSRLFGRRWGLAALVGIGLAWHEPDAPRWLWLWTLLLAALHGALREKEDVAWWLLAGRRAVWACLALVCVPFLISQARYAIYPDLERGGAGIQPRAAGQAFAQMPPQSVDELERGEEEDKAAQEVQEERSLAFLKAKGNVQMAISGAAANLEGPPAASSPAPARKAYRGGLMSMMGSGGGYGGRQKRELFNGTNASTQMSLDPNAKVTTGAGLPYWAWSEARLSWKGPVPQGHRIKLWLVPPAGSFALAWLRIALVILLALVLLGLPVDDYLARLRAGSPLWALPLVVLLSPGARAGEAGFPPRDLIDELRGRMLEAPECSPVCADSPRLRVQAVASFLSLSLDVAAAAPTAVPIPTGGRDWVPGRAALDGKPAGVRREGDGSLWIPVPAGFHTVTLEGALPDADAVSIALPLKPRRVEATVAGWTLHGVRENGRADDALQLSRARAASQASVAAARAQGVFPPFLRVERIVRLGLSWTVETRVTRLTPTGSPVSVAIPLLPGESVTSSDLRVVDGKAQASLAPQAYSTGWTSTLAQTAELKLAAPETSMWSESWRVEPGQVWHVSAKGLPAQLDQGQGGPRAYDFRPWPGEKAAIAIARPGALAGQTLTIDQTVLSLVPGLRATDATLSLSVRSSRGGQHALTLPDGADLLWARVDGAQQPLRLDKGRLVVPIQPGAHAVELSWREPGGARLFYRVPKVDAGASGVNDHVVVDMPAGRWTLFTGGPGMGPAVIFWSLLAVFLIVSIGLGAIDLAPLSWRQWFLLSLGLTQVDVGSAALVVGWFLAVGWRGRKTPEQDREYYAFQIFLAVLTFLAARALFHAIATGLLGMPDMQIAGNGSTASQLRWYLDRGGAVLPRPWALSVPLWVYRAAMLGWALWLADALLKWSRWAWGCYSKDGAWR